MQSARRATAKHVGRKWWCLALLLGLAFMRPNVLHAASNTPAVADAAKADDLPAVRKLIKEHADVNTPANDGSSALLWAAYHSNAEMTKALLAAGAAVDAANHYGVTPLLQASRNGDAEIIGALLDAGAEPTRWHAEGETPLMAASRTGRVDAVKLLLSKGSFVNAADPFQEETALMWASAEGHVEVVKALLAAGADPNQKAHVSTITTRKNADHPSGGFTALMFAVRNGHEEVAKALIAGGADPKLTNADGATATIVAIVNDRFDLAKELIDLGADPNDGSLFFAVDMHDATTDMRAHDGSRLQPNHPNNLTALGLVKVLLDVGADVNKPFVGALHSTTLCCGAAINSSPFYRAATAADVEVLKLLLAKGAQVEWSPAEVKPKDGKGPARPNPNAGRTPLMAAIKGGQGAPIAGGPGFTRIGPPVFREPGSRDPLEALNLLLAAGANPNAKAGDGSTPLHQAVQEEHVGMIRALAAAGGKLDAVNKDNLTPLLLAEAPKKPNPADMGDLDVYKPKRNSKEEIVAALRELMHLGPNDPAPQPPPLPKEADKKATDDKKVTDDKEKKDSPKVPAVTSAP
ncbi:MAG TPA: ankyrin repeat domain-containing protein [Bryobacteraceae bacterium]|jgi:cytohesin|nr:ankyrin repeat domain-containing protein [Bryobacteraceae bacterium]